MTKGSGDWATTPQAPATGETASELNSKRSSFGDLVTPDHPTTGRIDEAAATFGTNEGLVGSVAAGQPEENVGGAMATIPGSGIADQPSALDLDPEERAGVLGDANASRGGATAGGAIRGDLGESIDSTQDAATRTSREGDLQDLGS